MIEGVSILHVARPVSKAEILPLNQPCWRLRGKVASPVPYLHWVEVGLEDELVDRVG